VCAYAGVCKRMQVCVLHAFTRVKVASQPPAFEARVQGMQVAGAWQAAEADAGKRAP